MMFLGERGYRVIAHDRRGHGRSSQTVERQRHGHLRRRPRRTYRDARPEGRVLVGHSTGGGEVTRYIGRHGTARVAKAVLLGAVPPLMLKTDANPGWHADRGLRRHPRRHLRDRSQFFKDLTLPFYGYNRQGREGFGGRAGLFWLQGMQAGIKARSTASRQFSETDFTEDLKKFDVPTLIVHGDDDQIVPIGAAALLVEAGAGRDAEGLPGRPARPATTQQDQFNADLLAFIQG